jgi:hypothetical protein
MGTELVPEPLENLHVSGCLPKNISLNSVAMEASGLIYRICLSVSICMEDFGTH